jgi:hypothetical protein
MLGPVKFGRRIFENVVPRGRRAKAPAEASLQGFSASL